MSTFKSAFASARKSGKRTFMWNGKSYTTELAKGATGPKARPNAVDAKGPKVRATADNSRPKARASVDASMKAPSIAPDNLGGLAQRTKNAEARAAARKEKASTRKAKVQSDAASLRKKLGFDK